MRLFLQLQARAQEAKVRALSSVVEGKEVESEATTLHRELDRESLSVSFLSPSHSVCPALLFYTQPSLSTWTRVSSADSEKKVL